jgi:hypothetical protein
MTTVNVSQPRYRNTAPLAAIRAAAAAYGVSVPSTLAAALDRQAEVLRLVRSVPDSDHDLGNAVVYGEDVEQAVADAVAEKQRRDAVRAMNHLNALVNKAKGNVAATLDDSYLPLWQSIVKSIEKDAATVTKHAAALPVDALDPASVLAHNGGAAAYAAVEPVLARLDAAVDAMPYPRPEVTRTLPEPVARLLWLIDFEDVEPLMRAGVWDNDHSSPRSQRLRAAFGEFRKAVEENPRRALIDVARGRFDGITLAPAHDVEEVVARGRRFATSQVMVKSRDGERDSEHDAAGLVL